MRNEKIAVVGAVNVDICGVSDEQLVLYDSNPSKVTISFGGVGRNIAENLTQLGYSVDMITILADDMYTKKLIEYSEALGISFEHSMHIDNAVCSTYLSIHNNNGEMILGVSDMRIYDRMTVDFIATKMDFINSCDIVVIDTNMPEDVITYITENCKIPMIVDPVSTKKAAKVKDTIGKFTIIKPNIYEAEFLSGIRIEDDSSLKKAVEYFHQAGVKYVFITMGEEGVFYSDGEDSDALPICGKTKVENVSGCGDSFNAAIIWAYLIGYGIRNMAIAGECAASICAASSNTVTQNVNESNILKLMSEYEMKL